MIPVEFESEMDFLDGGITTTRTSAKKNQKNQDQIGGGDYIFTKTEQRKL